MKYCLYNIPHTYVYRRWRYLTAGVQYIFETRDLRAPWFQTPDTYMYLVRGNTIVARNDDYNGYASLIAYSPTVSGYYLLLIRAYSKYNGGTCDVYQSTGGRLAKIDNDVVFGGYPVAAHWKGDERIDTNNATGDTYLFLIHGNTMLRDDDGGPGLLSRITPGYEGKGKVIVGSYSRYSQGRTRLCNYYQSYLDNPGRSDEEEEDDPEIIVTDSMFKFQTELMTLKASLEGLTLPEQVDMPIQVQEERVKKLRDSILGAEDIKQLSPPSFSVPKDFIVASEKYEKLLKEAEEKLKPLSLIERAAEMAGIEHQKRELFTPLVPQEE